MRLNRCLRSDAILATVLCAALWLLVPAPCPGQEAWDGVDRIVVVGDIHGDYGRFVEVLGSAGVVNRSSKWSGGKAHLVQIGDVPDRGPQTRKILDLLMSLEKQAAKAGGRVHALIGNHDAMNVYGDLRYTIPAEYEEFRSARSPEIRDAFYAQAVEEERKKAEAQGGEFKPDDAFRKKWEERYPLGYFEHRYAWGPNGTYGQWIRNHNAVIRINDTLFVHAGIGPKYADFKALAINEKIRQELSDFSLLKGGIAMDTEGPLWYRGMAQDDEGLLAAHVESVLANHGVRRVVIGHTPTLTTILPRFGGKVILTDVGLSKAYGGPPACLVIEKGAAFAIHRGHKLAIPAGSGEELLAYLRGAASFDPQPSPIGKLIQELSPQPAPRSGPR